MQKLISQNISTQKGFIITMEVVFLLTLLGIGLFIGIVSIRDALFKVALSQQDHNFYVIDSADPAVILGKAMSFDEHEAPIVAFVDYDIEGTGINRRALIGVRDDRFTTRQPIFYSDVNCSDDPCIARAGSEVFTEGLDGTTETGSVSYINALQSQSYGIGAGNPAGLVTQGRLYREASAACTTAILQSMWQSQSIAANPCKTLAPNITSANTNPELATAVPVVDDNDQNLLDPLTPPFYTNMISTPSANYINTVPTGESVSSGTSAAVEAGNASAN